MKHDQLLHHADNNDPAVPSFGVLLRPEWAALLMSASTVTVTLNALTLGRVRLSSEAKRWRGFKVNE